MTADIELLAGIHAAVFEGADRWDPAALAAILAMPGVFATTAPAADGMAVFRVAADEAELLTLAVVPAARRQGVARLLLAACIRDCGALGARRLFLEVSETNHPARALYDRFGFAEVGRRRRYYPDGSTALVLAAPTRLGGSADG